MPHPKSIIEKEEIIRKLTKFRQVDKYQSFHEVMPHRFLASSEQRSLVTEILDNCAKELVYLYRTAKKNPTKLNLKKVIQLHMNLIAHAALDETNKEFAYKLCWFLAEKVAVNFPKQTAQKYWGYWAVEKDEVKTVKYKKPIFKMK